MALPDINKILRADKRDSSRGSPMGDVSYMEDGAGPLYLQRINFVDGDYAPDGTYWGGGPTTAPLWCAFTWPDAQARIFIRGWSRDKAAEQLLKEFPNAVLRQPARRAA